MLWLSAAVAAPTFVADEPHLRELGTAAWEAAVRCTGREGRSYPTVLVDVGPVRGGFAGTAHRDGEGVGWVLYGDGRPPEEFRWEGEGMYMIRLIAEDPTLLAHEVAHAWVYDGPPALVEGATMLLADCIAREDPARFSRLHPRVGTLADLVDLRLWANPHEGGAGRSEGYVASFLLMQELAGLVPPTQLWRAHWTWEELDRLLESSGPRGARLKAVLDGGVEAQRRYFADLDGDTLSGAEELRMGTDPRIADSNGDGWLDGVPPERYEGMRMVGRARRCLGLAAGDRRTNVEIYALGADGKQAEAKLFADGVPVELLPQRGGDLGLDQTTPSVRPVYGGVPATAVLTAWAPAPTGLRVAGGVVPDGRCWSQGGWMVTADRAVEAELPDFVVALQRLDARLTERLGPGPAQSVLFGGRKEDWRALRVEDWQIARAREVGWDHVAALVVTQSRCRDPFYGQEKVDNGVVEALARTLVPVPPGTLPWLAVDEGSIADGVARIAALGGWEQTLRAGCGG